MITKLYALLLEDVQKDAELLQEMLLDEGFDIEMDVVETEVDYIAKLKCHYYDIIFADFTLPSFDGEKALVLAKKICPHVPFICISGTIGEDRAVELLKQGATDYVLKNRMERLAFVTKRALDAVDQLNKFHQKEIELQTNRRLLQTVINNALDAIYVKDINGNYLLFNVAAEKAFGKTQLEVIGKDDTFIFSASEAQTIMDIDKKIIESGIPLIYEELLTLADGNIHTLHSIKCPMFDELGRITGLFGIVRDITESKKADEVIRQERVLLRTLIDNLPDAIYVKDNKGCKLVANSVDLKIMNCLSEAEVIGKTDMEIFKNDDGVRGYNEDMSVLQTGQPMLNQENCFFDAKGDKHWRLTSKIPLFNEQHEIIGLVGVGRNITERKRAEEALLIAKEKAEESDRLKTAFLHNISHEIRTPMNAIVGFSSLLNDPNLDFEKRKYLTNIIIQSSDNLLSMISDIIRIATIEAGQERIIEKDVDLHAILTHLYEQFRLVAQKQNVSFNLISSLSGDVDRIITDNTKLNQILSNLLTNALKFTNQGHVNLGCKLKEAEIEFYVEDTGIGISPEMHEEIFKRFWKVENGKELNMGGSGLGLSISKAYVELLGGKIWLNSELGKGSTFYFTIPYKKVPKNILAEKELNNKLNLHLDESKTILVAEDEVINFMVFKEILSRLNFKIIWAKNGMEAVEICKTNKQIDLVLMDIKMPVMDGYEATKLIKEINPNLPIIAQTAYSTEADKNRAIASGCSDFISKPIKKDLLISKIEEQLSAAKKIKPSMM